MSLVALRVAVVSGINTLISALRTCSAHGGRFDADELKRWAVRSPAVLVSVLGLERVEDQGGQATAVVKLVAFVLTAGASDEARDAAALALVETLASSIAKGEAFTYADAGRPFDVVSDNLYSGVVDQQGFALWAVTWAQKLDMAVYDSSGLDDFTRFRADVDLPPRDGVVEAQASADLQGTFMSAYGQISVSTPVATSVLVPNTYYKLAGTTVLGSPVDDVDMPTNNRLRHTGTVSKPFAVSASVSFAASADGVVTLALAKGGTVDLTTAQAQEFEVTGAVPGACETTGVKGIFNLAANEYVEVWATADSAMTVTAQKLLLQAMAL